jgi:uncharacterized peroxidase-related enzyme
MAHIQGTKEHGGNEELKAAFEIVHAMGWEHEGKPNNFMEALATRPAFITTLCNMAGSIFGGGEVPPTVKAMVWYTLAERVNCTYCAVANRAVLQQMGVDEAIIKSCAQDPDLSALPPAQRDIVNFGLKVAKKPQEVTSADYDVLREQGMSDGEILEIVMMAGYAVMVDALADALGIQLDAQ